MTAGAAPGIVVGLDGSEGSDAALDHACDEAALRGLALTGVIAWTPPDLWITSQGVVPDAHHLHQAAVEVARSQVDRVLAARAARGAPTPEVVVEAASGPAAVVLERYAHRAAMLVVGHRGRGAVASRLIGSVGLSCVVHAPCTVVVVRPPAA
ncbi:universal stress protein [Actinomycetospora straminea]|uniref:UspA domain-containing protein n=1 Tax=Actinomycetospora straminea TaxID=663607 RepID=A0ABP9ELS0_9PSEU|nr:universal stress protein [Actinomycetospora straminea]MDD7933167.1 universal stress protein [Actinomycetospora straminea]